MGAVGAGPITSAAWDTWVELNPHTADELGVKNNDVVIVESSTGRTIRVPVYVNLPRLRM